MALLDLFGVLLLLGATVGFSLGALGLGRSDDVEALFFLVTGFVALRAGQQLVCSGLRT